MQNPDGGSGAGVGGGPGVGAAIILRCRTCLLGLEAKLPESQNYGFYSRFWGLTTQGVKKEVIPWFMMLWPERACSAQPAKAYASVRCPPA